MKKNVGSIDKILRVVIALVAAYFAWKGGFDVAWKEYALWAVSIIMLGTTLLGTCPIYSILGQSTNKVNK